MNKKIGMKNELVDNKFEDEEIDLKYIIDNKPSVKIVREFLKYNLECIKDEGQELFEDTQI